MRLAGPLRLAVAGPSTLDRRRPAAGPGRPLVLPTFPSQKLWRDSLTALGLVAGRRLRAAADMEKFAHTVADAFCPEPKALAAVCFLGVTPRVCAPALEPLSRLEAVEAIRCNLCRLGIGEQMWAIDGVFRITTRLVRAADVVRLVIPHGLEHVGAVADRLPALLADRLG